MASLFGGSAAAKFDAIVVKATAETATQLDDMLEAQLEAADFIRGKQVLPKQATASIKKRLVFKNSNVQLLALNLLDICIKNAGMHFIAEVAQPDFMRELQNLVNQTTTSYDVRNKALEVIQFCGVAFQGKPELTYAVNMYNEMRMGGVNFPGNATSGPSAMIDAIVPPDWVDSTECMNCHKAFTTLTRRKHHCRNCGQVICYECSSNAIALPRLGIHQPVRVCTVCFQSRGAPRAPGAGLYAPTSTSPSSASPSALYASPYATPSASTGGLYAPSSGPVSSTSRSSVSSASKEDEELARVLEESRRAYAAEQTRSRTSSNVPAPPARSAARPPTSAQSEEDDPDLAAAIAASLRDTTVTPTTATTAPTMTPSTMSTASYSFGGPPSAPSKPAALGGASYPSLDMPSMEQRARPPTAIGTLPLTSSTQPLRSTATSTAPQQQQQQQSLPSPQAPLLAENELNETEKKNLQLFCDLIAKVEEANEDVVANRAIQDLYAKLSALQPKLVRSIHQASKKHRTYLDLDGRLAQCVALHEQLLADRMNLVARQSMSQSHVMSSAPVPAEPPLYHAPPGPPYDPSLYSPAAPSYAPSGPHLHQPMPPPGSGPNGYAPPMMMSPPPQPQPPMMMMPMATNMPPMGGGSMNMHQPPPMPSPGYPLQPSYQQPMQSQHPQQQQQQGHGNALVQL